MRVLLFYMVPRDSGRATPFASLEIFGGFVWLNGLVVSALGIGARGPRFDSRVAPLFHWVATLGKLFTHIASAVSQLQETGVQKGVFGA